jgi:hypothetical protein
MKVTANAGIIRLRTETISKEVPDKVKRDFPRFDAGVAGAYRPSIGPGRDRKLVWPA